MPVRVLPKGPRQYPVQATLDSTGAATVEWWPPNAGGLRITRISVTANTGQPKLSLYQGRLNPLAFTDGTYAAGLNTGEYPNGLNLGPGDFLTFAWTGGVADTGVSALIYAEDS